MANVDILLNAKNNASAALKQVKADLSGLDSAAKMAGGGLGAIGGAIGVGAVVAGVTQVTEAIGAMVAESSRVEMLGKAFEGLAASAGQSSQSMLAALRSASNGMVSDADLMLSANKAMMLGVADTAEEMASLLQIAQARGSAMGLSVSQAFSDIVTGLGRESALILDNLGIVIDSEAAMAEYAKTLGKTADALTSVERKQALVNAVMAQSQGMNLAAPTGAGAAAAQAEVAKQNAAVEVGQFFSRSSRDIAQGQIDAIKLLEGEWNSLDAAIRETGDSLADYEYPDEVVTGMQRFIEVAQQARQAQDANIEGAGLWTRMLDEMGMRAQTGRLTADDAQKIEYVSRAMQRARQAAEELATAQAQAADEAMRASPYYFQIAQRTEEVATAAFRASPEMQNLATKLGIVGAIALQSATDIESFNSAVSRINAGFSAADNVQAIRQSAISAAQANAQQAVDAGADPKEVAAQLGEITDRIWNMAGPTEQTTESMFLFGQEVRSVDDTMEASTDSMNEANAAMKRLASGGLSAASQAFDDLKSKVSSVLSGSTDLSFMGDTSDLFPREDAVNENARRLGAIAREGLIGQDWLEEFKSEVPDIYQALVDSGDPKGKAAELLKQFQAGLVPELIDKERAKQLVKDMLTADKAAAELAQEIAQELATELQMSGEDALAAANEALGVKGSGSGGDAIGSGAADAVDGGKVAQALSDSLKKQENLDLLYNAGKASGGTWASGFMATVGENIPKPLIDVLTTLVTPGVWAAIQTQQGLTGATP